MVNQPFESTKIHRKLWFRALKCVKMADFAFIESPKLISRKIWVIEELWDFHTVSYGKFYVKLCYIKTLSRKTMVGKLSNYHTVFLLCWSQLLNCWNCSVKLPFLASYFSPRTENVRNTHSYTDILCQWRQFHEFFKSFVENWFQF